jgi:hypothetical protein
MSWFRKGAEGAEAAKQDEEDRASRIGVYRLWLPAGGSAQFTFLDSEGFFFKEHGYYANGSWNNYETCIQDIGEEDCPFCEAGLRYYYECVFSIVDHTEFVSKKTQKRMSNTKKLLVLRSTARKKVLRKKDQLDGDLTYCRFESHRDDAKECNTGEDFDFIQRYSKEDVLRLAPAEYMGKAIVPNEWIKPFNYMELFAPKKAEQLRRILGRVPDPIGSGESASIEKSSEDDNKEDKKPSGSRPSVQSLL